MRYALTGATDIIRGSILSITCGKSASAQHVKETKDRTQLCAARFRPAWRGPSACRLGNRVEAWFLYVHRTSTSMSAVAQESKAHCTARGVRGPGCVVNFSCGFSCFLQQPEVDFNRGSDRNRLAVLDARFKAPFLNCFDCFFIETKAQRANNFQFARLTLLVHDDI